MMLQNIVKQEIIFYVMGVLLAFGVLAKLISSFTVRRMVRAAGEIHKSNHKLMKLVKAKFEHASMVSDKVQNVEAFVDKYLYEYRVMGIHLNAWRAIPKHVLWLIAILGVFAVFESYSIGGFGDLMVKYIQWTGIFVMILFLLYFIAEDKSRLQAAKNYMVEYLENVCIHRYAKLNKAAQTEEKEEQAELSEAKEEGVELSEADGSAEAELQLAKQTEEQAAEEMKLQFAEEMREEERNKEQEMRTRAILQEFLA